MNTFWVFSGVILAVVLGATAKAFYSWYKGETVENSFKQALDLTGLPIITFYQGNLKYNFLIDTGSTGCHIDSRYIPEEANAVGSTSVFGMEGNGRETKLYASELYLNGRRYTMKFLASDLTSAFDNIKESTGVTLHGILGSDFFKKYQYIIDFEKYTFYTNKR